MESVIEGTVDKVVDKRLKGLQGNTPTGDKRTGGRTTLPKVVADFIFGPDKS